LVARITRRYPFYSGCTRIANARWVERLAGRSAELAWARLDTGPEIQVPLDDFVGRTIYYVGDLDRKLSWICRRIVRPGDTVLDIGANLGVLTLTLSRLVGPTGRVHAFEPNPRMVELLTRSIGRNRCVNVRLYPIALGSKPGELSLWVPRGTAGDASLVRRFPPDGFALSVPVRRLDDVAVDAGLGPIRLIKIDTEGFEPEVLQGARDLLAARSCDAILFELNEHQGRLGDHPTFALLAELGYVFLRIPRRLWSMRLETLDPWDDRERIANGYADVLDFLAVLRGAPYAEIARRVGATGGPGGVGPE
jgi:FkbM family methyltransferase